MFTKVFALFRSPFALGIGVVALVAALGWGVHYHIDSRATSRAEHACVMAATQEQNQLLADAIHGQEEAHQFHLAEIARGDAISAQLSKTQRRLDATKTEYMAYANGITGNCPTDVGRVLMSWPAHSDSEGAGEDKAPSPPANTPDTVDASLIAGNIALNRWACDSNYAAHSALLEWAKEGTVNE